MAITGLEYVVLSSLRAHGQLPADPRVIELGHSNWYGDVPIEQLAKDLPEFVADATRRDRLVARLNQVVQSNGPELLYEIADVFFQAIFQPAVYEAIDPGTQGSQHRFDLNQPVPLTEPYDITLNIGTAEHVFNVWQFFKTAHDLTKTGGLMLHSSPFTGWPDHGFYCFQPTFFFDLARENRYEILSMVCAQFQPLRYVQIASREEFASLIRAGKIPANSHINVVFRRMDNGDFATPTQGYYAGALSPELQRMWHEFR